jgi:hypothetical protein
MLELGAAELVAAGWWYCRVLLLLGAAWRLVFVPFPSGYSSRLRGFSNQHHGRYRPLETRKRG